MRIVITRWGLDSYLDLLHRGVFDSAEYWDVLRPNILKLRDYPDDTLFKKSGSWGPATDRGGKRIKDGWKMKWHNIGNGKVQLRLCIGLVNGDAFLCHAYSKTSPPMDKRMAAKLKERLRLIRLDQHDERGEL